MDGCVDTCEEINGQRNRNEDKSIDRQDIQRARNRQMDGWMKAGTDRHTDR